MFKDPKCLHIRNFFSFVIKSNNSIPKGGSAPLDPPLLRRAFSPAESFFLSTNNYLFLTNKLFSSIVKSCISFHKKIAFVASHYEQISVKSKGH